ncbi:MAG: DUF664 domain-containing protein [Acidimicrobiales bacterium]|nr:DUF664 domain-containing protein [Acidimicrobiales bacterium]
MATRRRIRRRTHRHLPGSVRIQSSGRVVECTATSLDQLAVGPVAWANNAHPSLRWIMNHMIEEGARHNGHADLLREMVDGSMGM